MPAQPVPITVLSGFLGAGKTTLLNHLLTADHGLRVAVLVNDFGAINIDSQLVVGVEGDTVNLANGCICCTIRDDLVNETIALLQRPNPPEYIIIEASGVSDPGQVAQSFLLPRLRSVVQLDSIVAVIDAEQVFDLADAYAVLAMDQVGVADIVIINKIDLVSAANLARVRDWVREMNPAARLLEATHARVPLALLLGVGAFDPQHLSGRHGHEIHTHESGHTPDHVHTDHSLVFTTWSYRDTRPLRFDALRQVFDGLPPTIFRAKGIVYLDEAPDKRAVLQVTGKRVRVNLDQPWGDELPSTQIVLIGQPDTIDPTDLQARFDGALAASQPRARNPLAAATEWVRRLWTVADHEG